MKTLLKLFVGCILAVTLSSCFVTAAVSDDYGEAYVNYYPYYFCPDQNFYFNPDLDIYWWYQEGVWRSGSRLPYGYNLAYNTNYVIVTVSNRNPTLYYSQHVQAYRRGDYVKSTYHVGERPMQSLRSYRPDRVPSGYRSGGNTRNDDIYAPRKNSNYDNRGTRSTTAPQNNGSRSSGTWQNGSSTSNPSGTQQQNSGQGSNSTNQNGRSAGNTWNQQSSGNQSGSGQGNNGTATPSNGNNNRPQGGTQTQWNNGSSSNQNGQSTPQNGTYNRNNQWNNGNSGGNNNQGTRWQQSGPGNQTTRQPSTVVPQGQQQTHPEEPIRLKGSRETEPKILNVKAHNRLLPDKKRLKKQKILKVNN